MSRTGSIKVTGYISVEDLGDDYDPTDPTGLTSAAYTRYTEDGDGPRIDQLDDLTIELVRD